MTALAPTRPRLSKDFVQEYRRARVLQGFARAVARLGYREARVSEIVRYGKCARRTFYGAFGSKAGAGIDLLADVCPDLTEDFAGVDPGESATALFAVELAAQWSSGDEEGALNAANECAQIITWAGGSPIKALSGPGLGTLPPGRHGLPPDFVHHNQRQRLLSGAMTAVVEHGYLSATIADVVRYASVSRRSFYESFSSKAEVAEAMVYAASDEVGEWLEKAGAGSPLGMVVVEILGERLAGIDQAPGALAVAVAMRDRFEAVA